MYSLQRLSPKKLKPTTTTECGIQLPKMNQASNTKSQRGIFNDLTEMEKEKEQAQLVAFERRRIRALASTKPFLRKEARDAILADYKKVHSEAFP